MQAIIENSRGKGEEGGRELGGSRGEMGRR